MQRTSARCLLTAIIALVAAAAPAGAASLPLPARDVPGLHPAGSGKRVALQALGRKAPTSLRRASHRGAAFANGKRRLTLGVFTLRSSQAAKRVAAANPARTKVAGGRAEAVVLRRVGKTVAVVRYVTPGRRTARALQGARAYAASQAARLRRLLSQTAWERTLDAIRRDGTYSTATALRAFAIAYGPLPGVRRPHGPLGVPRSATPAMRMVARMWAHLTPAQRVAVDRALGARHGGPASSAPRARAAVQTLTYAPDYQVTADKYTAYFAAKLPQAGAVPVKVFKASEEITDAKGDALADAGPINDEGEWGTGDPAYCRVRVPPAGQALVGKPAFEQLMAHEVFHCFEFWLMPDWSNRSDWIMEGMAEWASIVASGVPLSVGSGWYADYLDTIDAPLFMRSYSAVGFWGRADEVAGSLWPKVPAVMTAAGDGAAFAAAGATTQTFVDTWASAGFRYPGAGAPWYQQRPYAVPYAQYPTPNDPVLDDAPLASEPYALRQYAVLMDVTRPLVHVVGTDGSLRVGTPKKDLGTVESQWYCYGSCTCPPGQGSTIPKHDQVTGDLAIGLTGGAAEGKGAVSFHALDEFCGKATGVSVSGGTNFTIAQPAFCIATPGHLRVEIAWNAGGVKQAHITLEVANYGGKGSYGPGQATVTAYDYRSTAYEHQWGPGAGSVDVAAAGTAYGFGASGTVKATLQSTSDKPTTVFVDGAWSCTRKDAG